MTGVKDHLWLQLCPCNPLKALHQLLPRLNKLQEGGDRDSSTFVHVEVKSYPQKREGLEVNLNKANKQLGKCDKLFQNVLAPAAKLTPWKCWPVDFCCIIIV